VLEPWVFADEEMIHIFRLLGDKSAASGDDGTESADLTRNEQTLLTQE
jgi:hypothetical protein